jgi:tetratricopeptide (TPR) repeat protein
MEPESTIQAGLIAMKQGEWETARKIFEQIVATQPENEEGWYFLAHVLPTAGEAKICLEKVLQINPQNIKAKKRLEKLNVSDNMKEPVNKSESKTKVDAQSHMAPAPAPPTVHTIQTQRRFSFTDHAIAGAMVAFLVATLWIFASILTTRMGWTELIEVVLNTSGRYLLEYAMEALFVVVTRFFLAFGCLWGPAAFIIASIRTDD